MVWKMLLRHICLMQTQTISPITLSITPLLNHFWNENYALESSLDPLLCPLCLQQISSSVVIWQMFLSNDFFGSFLSLARTMLRSCFAVRFILKPTHTSSEGTLWNMFLLLRVLKATKAWEHYIPGAVDTKGSPHETNLFHKSLLPCVKAIFSGAILGWVSLLSGPGQAKAPELSALYLWPSRGMFQYLRHCDKQPGSSSPSASFTNQCLSLFRITAGLELGF